MKSSLAAALRHSRKQAEETYDRRTANDRKRQAVSLARGFAEEQLLEYAQAPDPKTQKQLLNDSPGAVPTTSECLLNDSPGAVPTTSECLLNDSPGAVPTTSECLLNDSPRAVPTTSECPFKPGEFVGLVEDESSPERPKILLAQVHSVVGQADVSLLWYKRVSQGLYKLELSGNQWNKSSSCLVPVTVKPAAKRSGLYRLCTLPLEIHRAVFEKKKEV